MTHSFSYQGDDFCVTHGRDHMRYDMGNPIPWCQECEDERDAALEQARRDREYCAAQTGSDVSLINQARTALARCSSQVEQP